MKNLFFILILFLASPAYAEVKPPGALVATQCGDNIAETPFAGPDFPLEVCTWSVSGGDPVALTTVRPIFSMKSSEGLTFYIALGNVQVGENEWVWQGYKLNVTKPGAYYFQTGVDLLAPPVELTFIGSGVGSRVVGPMLDATLEPVFSTLATE